MLQAARLSVVYQEIKHISYSQIMLRFCEVRFFGGGLFFMYVHHALQLAY